MMMLAYNLFLLFKFDSLPISEYRQQIKTFRLKYVFLAAKIITHQTGVIHRTARYVMMKLSAKYPYQDVYNTRTVGVYNTRTVGVYNTRTVGVYKNCLS